MSNSPEVMRITITAKDEFTPQLGVIAKKARDTKKDLDETMTYKLTANVAQLEIMLKQARKMLKEATSRDEQIKLTLATQQFQRELTEAKRKLNNYLNTGDANVSRLQMKFNGLGDTIKNIGMNLANWVWGGVVGGIGMIGKSVVSLADQYDKARISFTTMLGSAQEAEKLLSDLSQFAKKTPFELADIRENAKQLKAMGIETSQLIPTMKALGDVSAGLNVPMSRLALNYGQVMSKGKLAGQELKDFTTAGVPLLDELATNLNKSKIQIQEMVSAGEISSEMVAEAFRTMTSEGGRFADLMAQQSSTVSGMRANLSDSAAQLGEKVGLVLIPWLQKSIDMINGFFDEPDNKFEEALDETNKKIREQQNILSNAREELNALHQNFQNGKIVIDYYNHENMRLREVMRETAQEIERLNKLAEEQQAISELNIQITSDYTQITAELNDEQARVQEQLQLVDEEYQKGLITQEEAIARKQLLTEQSDALSESLAQETEAQKKEAAIFEILQESGMKAHDAKNLLASLTIENSNDLKALTKEQQEANKLASSYLEVAKAKAKAQANVTELKGKLEANNNKKSRLGTAGSAIGGVLGTIGGPVLSSMFSTASSKISDWAGSKYFNKQNTDIQQQLDKAQELLTTLEKIEQGDAYIVGGRKPKKSSVGTTTPILNEQDTPTSRGGGGGAKSRTRDLIQELEKQKALEIKAVQESEATEEEKMEKLQAIKIKYDKKKLELEKKSDEYLLKETQNYMKKIENERNKDLKDHNKKSDQAMADIERYKEKIDTVKDKFGELKEKASETLRGINQDIKHLDSDHIAGLGARYYEVSRQLRDNELDTPELSWLTQGNSVENLEQMLNSGVKELSGVDISKIIEHVKLKQELLLLEQHTTLEQQEQAKIQAEKSQTTKLIEQYNQQKQALLEKKGIIEAINNMENIDSEATIKINEETDTLSYYDKQKQARVDVIDAKNEEYARDLLNQQQKLNTEYENNKKHLEKNQQLAIEHSKAVIALRNKETSQFQYELDERSSALKLHTERMQAMIASLEAAKASSRSSVINNNQITNSNNRTTNHNYTIIGDTRRRPSMSAGLN